MTEMKLLESSPVEKYQIESPYLTPKSRLNEHIRLPHLQKQIPEEDEDEEHVWGFKRQPLSAFLMALGVSLLTLGFVYANEERFHPSLTGVVRGLTAIVIPYFIARYQDVDLTFPSRHNFKWQLIRNGIMVFQGYIYSWSQFYIPLPIVVTIYAATPVFSAFFDWLIFGVGINCRQKVWFGVAVVGVLLTANGGSIMNASNNSEVDASQKKGEGSSRYFSHDPLMVLLAGLILVITQIIQGIGVVITKKMKNTCTLHVTYFVGLMLLLINAVMVPSGLAGNEGQYHNPSIGEFLVACIFSGIPLVIGMLCFNASLTLTRHYGTVAPFQFASIVVGYFLSIFRYEQHLNWICVWGTVLTCSGVVFVLREREKEREPGHSVHIRKDGRVSKFSYDSEMM